ncbi:MAG: ScpA family protein [Nanoarchaeota archaeon]|nr:ScpA family protein [Nanoarchaeota archaeon]
MNDKIYSMLIKEDEVTWQSLLYSLVKNEGMDPWDVNISQLTQKYIKAIKELKEHDFRISGKVLLAAAILLKIQSNKLLGEDLSDLDRLIAGPSMDEDGFYEDLENFNQRSEGNLSVPPLTPRTPQPRLRKVSIYDLVGALQKALEVKKRRLLRNPPVHMNAPEKKIDISALMERVYKKILIHFEANQSRATFTQLLPSHSRQDKIHTFVPLLHLTNQRKIDMHQQNHFGEIEVELLHHSTDPKQKAVEEFKESLEKVAEKKVE